VKATLAVAATLVFAPIAGATVPGFATPSRNIVCEADHAGQEGKLSCVVFSASDRRGQKTWSMLATGRAGVRFVQANIATEVPALRYGRTWRWPGFTCTSRRAGLTCRNRSGHGFFLSRSRQRLF
jgi:hypothetical protein